MDKIQKNVLGEKLEECSLDPLTGWYRDGCCNTDEKDKGLHTVCAKVTNEFLEWCIHHSKNSFVTLAQTVCSPLSFSSVLQQPSRYQPVKGSREHSSNFSPRTFF